MGLPQISAQACSFSPPLFLALFFRLCTVRCPGPSLYTSGESIGLCLLEQYRVNRDWRRVPTIGIRSFEGRWTVGQNIDRGFLGLDYWLVLSSCALRPEARSLLLLEATCLVLRLFLRRTGFGCGPCCVSRCHDGVRSTKNAKNDTDTRTSTKFWASLEK